MDWLYTLFLTLHNILRWVTLVLAILATVMAFTGWFGKREWGERDRKIGSFTAMAMDIQFLLGLILYVVLSPFGIKGLSQGMEFVNANRDYRFFGLEHVAIMVLAVVFAHLGTILPRKASTSLAKFKRAAIPFAVMFILLVVAIPWWRPLLRIFSISIP
jgi:hypothetical protein